MKESINMLYTWCMVSRVVHSLMTVYELCLVSRMREKAVSGMMATVHKKDTDVEEREERISHLKKVMLDLYVFALIIIMHDCDRSLKN